MTTTTAFGSRISTLRSGGHGHDHGGSFGKLLLTVREALQRWSRDGEERRLFATLDLRALDDIGLTRADRDALLRR